MRPFVRTSRVACLPYQHERADEPLSLINNVPVIVVVAGHPYGFGEPAPQMIYKVCRGS